MDLISQTVLPNVEANIKKNMLQFEEPYVEERAFFYKLVGDYYRYAAEATSTDDDEVKQAFKEGALEYY